MTGSRAPLADLRLRDAVVAQLDWDSRLDASEIGVSAKGGAVILTGSIDSYAAKLAAERAAKRVRGVRAVANDIQVTLRHERGDAEIANDAARALGLRPSLRESVQAAVHSGHVTLTGTVTTLAQSAIAEHAVRHIRGVKGIVNRIGVDRGFHSPDLPQLIAAAFRRDAGIDPHGITVTVAGGTIVLEGQVHSWLQREAAENAVMHARGVTSVDNRIAVAATEPDNVDQDVC